MKDKDDDKIDNNIPSLLQLVPLRGPVAKVDKSHWFLSLFQNNTCEYFLNPLLLLLYSLHYSSPVPPWSNQSILANSFFSLSFFLFIIIDLFHHDPTKNIFFSSSTVVLPPRQQRRPFCECFRSGFCFWSLSSLDEVAPYSGWCAFRLIVFTGSFLYLFPPFSVPRLRQDWLWSLKIS